MGAIADLSIVNEVLSWDKKERRRKRRSSRTVMGFQIPGEPLELVKRKRHRRELLLLSDGSLTAH